MRGSTKRLESKGVSEVNVTSRLNQKPIFIVGFARGGTNILLNLLRSHPNVCSPRGETHQVFKGKGDDALSTRIMKVSRYLPITLLEQQDVFGADLWETRKPFKPLSKKRIDQIFFRDKLRAQEPSQNLYKRENERYTDEEIANSRLLCKNLNGIIFLSEQFSEMYPDATFIALVRNGFAVCEGHIRRGSKVEYIASRYEKACQQMIRDAEKIPNFHLLRYEDTVTEPRETLKKIFALADLDAEQVTKVRLQTKQVMTKEGQHEYVKGTTEKQTLWYDLDEMASHFKLDANENQIARLSDKQKSVITELCRPSLNHFGYL